MLNPSWFGPENNTPLRNGLSELNFMKESLPSMASRLAKGVLGAQNTASAHFLLVKYIFIIMRC